MVETKNQGMDRVNKLYEDRGSRARELRAQGKKVIGYFCCYPPLELMTALDLVPYRIQGSVHEPITQADAYLESVMCPFMRSCFDLSLKGEYDFLDGLVVPHSCDTVLRIHDIWKHYRKPAYTHTLNVPHMVDASSSEFFKQELRVFQGSLEGYAGRKMTPQGLDRAIELHNRNRALLHELYDLRRQDPPLVSGAEVIRVLVAGMGLPVEEFSGLLRGVIDEVPHRDLRPGLKPRVLVYGTEIDDDAFIRLVEESGANVVMDDLCTASRSFWDPVEVTPDRLDGLVERYLEKVHCPRTYRPRTGDREQDWESRFGYLRDFARDFGVVGVIFYIIRFCDTYEFDAPDVRDFLEGEGFRVLHLEDDYNLPSLAQLRTRVEAFLETIAPA